MRWLQGASVLLTLKAKVFASIAFGVGVVAGSPEISADTTPEFSFPLSMTCETSAVKLDSNPFEASQGHVSFEIKLNDGKASEVPGRWKVTGYGPDHHVSFAKSTSESCTPDCPFTQGENGGLQLWSPKPLGLTQLDDKSALILVTIDAKTLELKASTFRNKELAGLERGDCRIAGTSEEQESNTTGNASPADAPPDASAEAVKPAPESDKKETELNETPATPAAKDEKE